MTHLVVGELLVEAEAQRREEVHACRRSTDGQVGRPPESSAASQAGRGWASDPGRTNRAAPGLRAYVLLRWQAGREAEEREELLRVEERVPCRNAIALELEHDERERLVTAVRRRSILRERRDAGRTGRQQLRAPAARASAGQPRSNRVADREATACRVASKAWRLRGAARRGRRRRSGGTHRRSGPATSSARRTAARGHYHRGASRPSHEPAAARCSRQRPTCPGSRRLRLPTIPGLRSAAAPPAAAAAGAEAPRRTPGEYSV